MTSSPGKGNLTREKVVKKNGPWEGSALGRARRLRVFLLTVTMHPQYFQNSVPNNVSFWSILPLTAHIQHWLCAHHRHIIDAATADDINGMIYEDMSDDEKYDEVYQRNLACA